MLSFYAGGEREKPARVREEEEERALAAEAAAVVKLVACPLFFLGLSPSLPSHWSKRRRGGGGQERPGRKRGAESGSEKCLVGSHSYS